MILSPISRYRVSLIGLPSTLCLSCCLHACSGSRDIPFPLVAISVGALILVSGRVKAQNVYQRLDGELLLLAEVALERGGGTARSGR
jgi:hypothetical protein